MVTLSTSNALHRSGVVAALSANGIDVPGMSKVAVTDDIEA